MLAHTWNPPQRSQRNTIYTPDYFDVMLDLGHLQVKQRIPLSVFPQLHSILSCLLRKLLLLNQLTQEGAKKQEGKLIRKLEKEGKII